MKPTYSEKDTERNGQCAQQHSSLHYMPPYNTTSQCDT
jgi:hypothetical protein